jgi:Transposase and inactivated derivatives
MGVSCPTRQCKSFVLRALRGIELGYSAVDLAELLGVCHETISRWWTSYCADGLDSLPGGRTGRPLGSGRFLSDQQADRIKALIDDNSPEQLGIAAALWTRRAVRDLIQKEFQVVLAERTVGQYPATLGLHLQEARAALAQTGSRRGPAVAAGDVPGHRRTCPEGRCGDPLD